MKFKFALKILEGNQKFVAVFAGSSVTAGHDNFLNESYPEVYERRMREPLEALGIEFEMRNIAMVSETEVYCTGSIVIVLYCSGSCCDCTVLYCTVLYCVVLDPAVTVLCSFVCLCIREGRAAFLRTCATRRRVATTRTYTAGELVLDT